MKVVKILALSFLTLGASTFVAQTTETQNLTLEGSVFGEDNDRFVKNVTIIIIEGDNLIAKTSTDKKGLFKVEIPIGPKYQIIAKKKRYFQVDTTLLTAGLKPNSTIFTKLNMERKPGYVFDVSLSEGNRKPEATIVAIDSARIEIYNNTTKVEELALEKYPLPFFKFTFERGNHYTIMIRKKGFFNKRIEAYVDVEKCILCFDGLGTVDAGVLDIMSHDNKMGTFLANVEMEPLEIDKVYSLDNIYYNFDKWNIRPDAAIELDNLVGIFKDNPGITVELSSHTDARGNDDYNMLLSQRRAKSAVDYLVSSGSLNPDKLVAKGYGETQLTNKCKSNVACSEKSHQANRRTELKIVGIDLIDPLDKKSLKEIIEEESLLRDAMSKEVSIEPSKN